MSEQNKNRILIVDDSIIYCELIARKVSEVSGTEIAGKATNAKDAEAKLDSLRPDIVIVDMTIQGIMKNEFIEKANAKYKADIIVISALKENNIFMSEAVKFVPKPVNATIVEKDKFLTQVANATRNCVVERTNKHIKSLISNKKQGGSYALFFRKKEDFFFSSQKKHRTNCIGKPKDCWKGCCYWRFNRRNRGNS